MSPAYIFLIDVSLSSYQTGYLACVLEIIKDLMVNPKFENPDRTKVAIITYDTSVHYYRISEDISQPLMLCVSSQEMFLPAPVKFLNVIN